MIPFFESILHNTLFNSQLIRRNVEACVQFHVNERDELFQYHYKNLLF